MKKPWFFIVFVLLNIGAIAQEKKENRPYRHGNEYHVSVNGSDSDDGSILSPFKTISAAADKAMPGDVITVHAGIYRERITPPRCGNSENKRIIYQAAKGEICLIHPLDHLK